GGEGREGGGREGGNRGHHEGPRGGPPLPPRGDRALAADRAQRRRHVHGPRRQGGEGPDPRREDRLRGAERRRTATGRLRKPLTHSPSDASLRSWASMRSANIRPMSPCPPE